MLTYVERSGQFNFKVEELGDNSYGVVVKDNKKWETRLLMGMSQLLKL